MTKGPAEGDSAGPFVIWTLPRYRVPSAAFARPNARSRTCVR